MVLLKDKANIKAVKIISKSEDIKRSCRYSTNRVRYLVTYNLVAILSYNYIITIAFSFR